MHSVVDWIHYSNKIEGAGFDSKSDTESAALGQLHSERAKDVTSTLNLLRQTYKVSTFRPKKAFDAVGEMIFDVPALHKWHRALTQHLMPVLSGCFRTWGVDTKSRVGRHVYPHHSILPTALSSFSKFCYDLCKAGIKTFLDRDTYLLFIFGYAAFVQFHFVDLHPYVDGNGRMCRFLSKRILDNVCPVPFPQFKNRDQYIAALELGRGIPTSSSLLANLLLESAIDHYEAILLKNENSPFVELLVATQNNLEEFKERMHSSAVKDLSAPDKAILERTFVALDGGMAEDVQVGNRVVRIKAWPSFSLDDI